MKLLSIFSCLFWIANAAISVDTESRHFVDESNRVRIFHGVNVVYKIAPYVSSRVFSYPCFMVFKTLTQIEFKLP